MKPCSLFLLLLTLLLACKKSPEAVQPVTVESVMQFETCACSDDAKGEEEYISAEIDGVPICFDVLPPGLPDTFSNHLRYGYIGRDTGDQYFDNVYMIRNCADSKWQIAFFLENTHALKKQYPYSLPRADPYYCEIGEVQLISQEHFAPCSSCAGTNSYSYLGAFNRDYLSMTVNSFNNNFFEGIFSGMMYSKVAKPVNCQAFAPRSVWPNSAIAFN